MVRLVFTALYITSRLNNWNVYDFCLQKYNKN